MGNSVRPIARLRRFPNRLLLRDEEEHWLVWPGNGSAAAPVEIAEETAWWLLSRTWVEPLPVDCPWMHVSDLPVIRSAHPPPSRR